MSIETAPDNDESDAISGKTVSAGPLRSLFGTFAGVFSGEYLSFLAAYALRHKRLLIWGFVLSLPLTGISAVMALLVKSVTGQVSEGGDLGRFAEMRIVLWWVAAFLSVIVLRSILEIVNRYLMTRLDAKVSYDIRNDLYQAIQDRPLGFHLDSRSGELTSLISNDVQCSSSGILEIFSGIWLNPVKVLVLLGVMLYFNPLLSLFGFLSLPVLGYCVTAISRKARHSERNYLRHYGGILDVMTESLTNVKQVKALSVEDLQSDKMAEKGRQVVKYRCQATLAKALVSPVAEITGGLTLTFMIMLAHYQITHGLSGYKEIAACLTAAWSMKSPIKQIARSVVQLQRSVAATQRIMWVMPRTGSTGRSDLISIDSPLESLELEDVTFSYDGRNDVLTDVNITLTHAQRVAVFGDSGSGKTTLVDLITGFYPCSSGAIRGDGINLADIEPALWRRRIGMVTQDPFLFNISVRENILYGCEEASEKDFEAAIRAAGVQEIIAGLPDGLDTVVGERGERLSGGQRKRIALARALVRPISILILDEVISELDQANTESLLQAVDALAGDMLIIHVSHNPVILDHCDRFLLVRDRTLTEMTADALRQEISGAGQGATEIRRARQS